jgi:hypothetical protein
MWVMYLVGALFYLFGFWLLEQWYYPEFSLTQRIKWHTNSHTKSKRPPDGSP